jgi:excisionase family DNA binding protein
MTIVDRCSWGEDGRTRRSYLPAMRSPAWPERLSHVAVRSTPGLAESMATHAPTRSATKAQPGSRYTDVRGIAEHLAISERHVRRLVLERRIPHRKVGSLLRFEFDEVDAWMDTLRRGPVR